MQGHAGAAVDKRTQKDELGKHFDSAVIELVSLRLEAGWCACSLVDRVDLFCSILFMCFRVIYLRVIKDGEFLRCLV